MFAIRKELFYLKTLKTGWKKNLVNKFVICLRGANLYLFYWLSKKRQKLKKMKAKNAKVNKLIVSICIAYLVAIVLTIVYIFKVSHIVNLM